MGKEIEFRIKLIDSVSGVAKQVHGSLEGVDNIVEHITSGVNEAHSGFKRFANFSFRIGMLQNALSGVYSALDSVTAGSKIFETGMAKVNTMAGKGKEELKGLTAQVRQLAKDIPVARDMLTEGLYQTISNGVPENNWLDFLNKSSKASVGGVANLGKVVTVTSTIIKNYGLEWDKVGIIQDKIQKTAKLGVTSFEQMSEALPRVAGNAATLGVNIDDLLGTFATLTGVSGNTAEVSTQLAAVFTALVKPTSEATEMAKKMDLTFNAVSIKKAGGLIPFIQQLDTQVNSYVKKTGTLKENVYASLFGSAESLRAIIPLVGPLSSDFESKTQQIRESAGTIDAAFKDMSVTAESKSQLLKNKLENLGDSIFNATKRFLPFIDMSVKAGQVMLQLAPLTELASSSFHWMGIKALWCKKNIIALAHGISLHNLSLKFNRIWTTAAIAVNVAWNKTIKQSTLSTLRFPAALTASSVGYGIYMAMAVPATIATLAFTIAIKSITKAIYAIPIVGWILAIVAAVIALVGLIVKGFKWLWNNCIGFRKVLFGIWEVVKYIAGAIWNIIISIGSAITSFCLSIWNSISGLFSGLWMSTSTFFSGLWLGITDVLESAWQSIAGFFTGIWSSLTRVFTPIRDWVRNNIVVPLKNAFSGLWNFIKGILNKVMNKLDGMLAPIRQLWNKLFGGTSAAWKEGTVKGRASYAADHQQKSISQTKLKIPGVKVAALSGKGKSSGSKANGGIISDKAGEMNGSGNRRVVNNYISIGSLIESLTIQSASLKEGVDDMKAMVIKALLEVLNSQNKAAAY